MADDSDPSLDIHIRTTADGDGAQQATRDIQGVEQAAGRAGTATATAGKEGAKGFGEAAHAGREAAEVVRGIEHASEGGVRGFIGLTHAARGLAGLLKTAFEGNPLGVLLIGISSAIGLFAALKHHAKEAGDEAKTTGTDFQTAAQAANKLAEQNFEKLGRRLTALKKQADDFLATLNQANALFNKRDETSAAARIASIDSDPNISPEEKIKKAALIKSAVTKSERDREDEELQKEVTVKGRLLLRLEEERAKTEQERIDQEKIVTEAVKKQKLRKDEIATLEQREIDLHKEEKKLNLFSTEGANRLEQIVAEKADASERLENLRFSEKNAQTPAAKAAFEKQSALLATKLAQEKDVRGRAESAAEDFGKADVKLTLASKLNPQIRAAEDLKSSIETKEALSKALDIPKLREELKKGLLDEEKLKSESESSLGFGIGGTDASKALDARRAANQSLRDRIAKGPSFDSSSDKTPAGTAKTDQEILKALLSLPDAIGKAVGDAVNKGGTITKDGETFKSEDGHLKKVAEATADTAKATKETGEAIVKNAEDTKKELQKTQSQLKNLR